MLDCLGAEQPPFSQGTLVNFRMRLIAHNLAKALLVIVGLGLAGVAGYVAYMRFFT